MIIDATRWQKSNSTSVPGPHHKSILSGALRAFFWGVVIGVLLAVDWARAQRPLISVAVQRISDTTHIEFQGLSQWSYNLKRPSPELVTLSLPALEMAAVGQLSSWSDSYVKKVEVLPVGPDGRSEVKFHLTDKAIESFDYLTDSPSRLIVDFYRQLPSDAGPTVKEPAKPVAPVSKAKPVAKKAPTQYQKKELKRKPAGSEFLVADKSGEELAAKELRFQQGIFDAEDPDYIRFQIKDHEIREEAVIASKQNIYIRFPMLKLESSPLAKLLEEKPEYVIKSTDSRENKEAQLLKTLHEKKRSAAFLKTFNYFTKKYPQSPYREIVNNMAAEVYFNLWQESRLPADFEAAKGLYLQLIDEFRESVLTERNEFLIAFADFSRGGGLETIQRFMDLVNKYPKSENRDWARRALAESYLAINKYDEAMKVLGEMSKESQDKKTAAEARYRMGDVHMAKKDYEAAVATYRQAIKESPDFQNEFPNAWYNLAEAHFWQGQHRDSLNNYLEYIRRFPHHSHGGYALTRVGELLEIMGANPAKSMGAFLESYFRFKNSEGANVARVRMLSQRMQVMKEKELKNALEELTKISTESTLPRVREFVTLMVADGYMRREEFDQSLNYLVSYYQANPTSTNLDFFKTRILKNISGSLGKQIRQGDYMKALEINSQYTNTWLRRADRLDVPYFVGNAFEQAGVFSEAEQIYAATLRHLEKIKGTNEEKERRVHESLPSLNSVRLRLAKVNAMKRQYGEAYNHLTQVKGEPVLSPSEQVEKVELEATLAQEKGQMELAKRQLRSLIDNWKDQPRHLAAAKLRLAELQQKTGDWQAALDLASDIEQMHATEANQVKDDDLYQALAVRAEALVKLGKVASGIDTYQQILERFEEKKPIQSLRYRAGQVLFENGDVKGAEKMWSGLKKDSGDMYRKLADERLRHVTWQEDYKRYIERIPAAASLKREK